MKNVKQIEKNLKGVANHWRIQILILLDSSNNLTLESISQRLKGNIKTLSEHTRRLAEAEMIEKKYFGSTVIHSISPLGKKVLSLIRSI